MKKPGALNFEVGQLAEMKSFEEGFRSAWFRCKIMDIELKLKEKKILPEYYDFDPAELTWEELYQEPPYSQKPGHVKIHLMVRPQYPMMYKKSEMPPLDSISQVCVVIDGTWKVGDLVDWFADGCYWSVTVVKVLSNDKFQVKLPMRPIGERKKGEKGIHEAFGKDFRPSLNWSPTEGWTLPTVEGRTACNAQLLFPTKQGNHLEPEPAAGGSTTCISAEEDRDSEQNEVSVKMDCDLGMEPQPEPEPEPAAAGSTTRMSAEGDRDNEQNEVSVKMDCDLGMEPEPEPEPEPAAAGSTTRMSAEGDRASEQNEKSVKMDCDLVESSESISSLQKKIAEDKVEKRELNIMHEDTLEAAIIDLEELVTKVKWLQRLLQSPSNDATPSSWKFA